MSTALGAFGSAFAVIFLAEFGDKTQLALVAISRPGQRMRIWLGASIGFLALSAVAVSVGTAVSHWLNLWMMALISGAVFLFFGVRSLQTSGEKTETPLATRGMWAALGLVMLTELGDKSQLSTATLAATGGSPAAYGLGAAAALSLNAGLAVLAGTWISTRLPKRLLAQLVGALFIVLGLASWGWAAFLLA